MGDTVMEPVAVDLEPLRRSAGLRDILTYERICGIPPHRRFLVILVAVLLFAVAMLTGLWFLGRGDILTVAPILGIFVIGYTVLAAVGFLWWAVGLSRRVKIAAFAWQNGWAYADLLERTRRPGAAFTRVVHGRERAVIACDDARMPFELGMHHSVSRGQERATIQRPFAFIELPLPASVPHIVLANRKHSIVPTLGLGRGAARMELEGDFAKTFRLIVPEGYQQDALYIFTPDLMARVLDLGSGAEIELVSDRLYVYLPSRTRFDRAETMAAAVTLAEEFHRRFTARTELYRDDAGGLAARAGVSIGLRGQRLGRRGISVFAVAGTAAVLLLSAGITAFSLFGGDLLSSLVD
ncbi:DUF3137 domain-containing protein [Microbacterium oxydans]|uniref:hypothetical protein n=1 Tax=Microbacterium oxydans TaxID=82380 RepID=UPI00114460E8|nr:hypothetical protein [Microbacterium oxydans]KAB1889866.1 DUF3137 domain-containing protein [Microbacterium oxydans]GED40260.1 hypothetical protein MOX01_34020 [Microbacterium oxydans]